MFIEKSSTAQELPQTFEQTLNENGWNTSVKFRVVDKQKYADVRLFESFGTDYEKRRMGMAFGYDTSKTNFSDNRVISETSSLGVLGMGNGTNKYFQLKAFPIDEMYGANVFVDGVRINENRYKLNNKTGFLEFLIAPEMGQQISISYQLDKTAPEPPAWLVFFTYNSVNLGVQKGIDAPLKLADGDGVTKTFNTPTAPVGAGTLRVWNDSIEQIEGEHYTVNLTTGEITFEVAPLLGKELTVKYTQIIAGTVSAEVGAADGVTKEFYTPAAPIAESGLQVFVNGTEIASEQYVVDYTHGKVTFNAAPVGGKVVVKYLDLSGGAATGSVIISDITASKSFTIDKPLGVMEAVYAAMDFVNPSLPTVLSFAESGLGTAWQRDSLIHYWGQITRNSGFFYMRADAGANAVSAYYAPLYFGRMLATHQKPTRNMVLFAGAATNQEIAWKAGLKIGGINVDYGPKTSNGNSSVQVAQTIGGAYYQAHNLGFMTYAKAGDNGEGAFNPSQYLKVEDGGIKKPAYVHSRVRLVHPNDGYLYELDNMFVIHPKKVVQHDKMRVRKVADSETIGYGDGMKHNFILSRNRHESEDFIVMVDCVVKEKTDYTYDPETKTITLKEAPALGKEVFVQYSYKQEYLLNIPTAPRCPMLIDTVAPYAPIATLCYKNELSE